MLDLQQLFGQIDIYLFDQLLKGRISPSMRIFDAGCGGGRNLVYLLREGYDVSAVDVDPRAIDSIRRLAAAIAPTLPAENFRVAALEEISEDASFDVVLCNAVLHFARDDAHFAAMLRGVWRALKPGGLFFARLASDIGMENRFRHIQGHRFQLLDGSERYLVDEAMLLQLTVDLGGQLIDPLKTTVVQGQRCMTTWVMRK